MNLIQIEGGLDALINTARDASVARLLSVSVEMADYPVLCSIADTYEQVDIATGVHPNHLEPDAHLAETLSQNATKHSACVAIGETGLDFYRLSEESEKQQQMIRFRAHIEAARVVKMPLIIHMRQASNETLKILREEHGASIGGVMHCFTENWEIAKQAMDLGFYISISGIVTFKNANIIQEVAKKIPSDRLLVETDAPYLAPVPYRGKINCPAFLIETVKFIAALRGESFEKLSEATTENYFSCFKRKSEGVM